MIVGDCITGTEGRNMVCRLSSRLRLPTWKFNIGLRLVKSGGDTDSTIGLIDVREETQKRH